MQSFHPKQKPLAIAMRMLLAFSSVTFAYLPQAALAAASHQTESQSYDIPSGSLTGVLNNFAQAAGVVLSFDPALTAGKTSKGLKGSYTIKQGFDVLLRDAGLQVVSAADGGFTLKVVPLANVSERTDVLPEVAVRAKAEKAAMTEGNESYAAQAITIGKGAHSLKETPQSVTVLTRKFLDDQNLNTIEQVMEKTPGITVYDSPMGGKYFYSRGFMMLGQYQYDGVPLDSGGNYVQADSFSGDMAYYDRVEVLRGAAGMMKGVGTSSGAVNLVRKRGQDVFTNQITFSAGSWDNYRAQLDVGGPLNEDGSLRGRTVVAVQDRQFFYDLGDRKDQILYAALDYDISPATTIGVAYAYENLDSTPCFHGLPRYADGSDLKLKRSTCASANWNNWRSERSTLFADIKHRFNEDWLLSVASVYTHNLQDIKYAYSEGAVPLGASATSQALYSGLFDYNQQDYGVDANLTGKFAAFGRQHELTVGMNASRSKKNDYMALIRLPQTLNLFAPNHHIPEPDDSVYAPTSYRGGPVPTRNKTTQYGMYANLRYKLADPLTMVVGSRVSWYRDQRDSYTLAWDYWQHDRSRESGEVTPFAALIYDITPNLALYASYADIFQPQSTYVTADGSKLQPKTGTSYELGIKGDWLDGRLNTAFTLFRTVEKNRAETDYSSSCVGSSDGYCYTDTGKVRAQGAEAEVSGQLLERLQVMAGYTYTETEYLKNITATNVGAVYNSYVPRHLFRAWSEYKLAGDLERWSLGGGVNLQSDNYRQVGTIKVQQGGYAVWNARVNYRLDDKWSLALNLNNIFDKRYYSTIGAVTWGNFYGEPRSAMLTLRGSF